MLEDKNRNNTDIHIQEPTDNHNSKKSEANYKADMVNENRVDTKMEKELNGQVGEPNKTSTQSRQTPKITEQITDIQKGNATH